MEPHSHSTYLVGQYTSSKTRSIGMVISIPLSTRYGISLYCYQAQSGKHWVQWGTQSTWWSDTTAHNITRSVLLQPSTMALAWAVQKLLVCYTGWMASQWTETDLDLWQMQPFQCPSWPANTPNTNSEYWSIVIPSEHQGYYLFGEEDRPPYVLLHWPFSNSHKS